ncbi:DUF4179 domain-containing protein [Bacillus sp. FJAT-26390]|uniref:DUF4179 domain-containing protein n=1 Tax=Bacillus sp. FJAT-26390 TaxID=1743142 RepID=UPI000807E4A8|nr:DUF4179 domain-containing protein [Bacillus sp. FJAT-26390]OBZ17320.1 anti-sigma factor [Bacillus sp. FJAT-26390]
MKDVYELLNDIDIDEHEFVEMEVDDFEKAKVKEALKESINKKKKVKGWKKKAAAAAIIVGVSAATFGVTFPAYAVSIPVIGDIFRFLDNGRTGLYEDYKQYSTALNMSQESNGIKITINDAIYDGKTVSLTFSIESERQLADHPISHPLLDIKGAYGSGGSIQISKVDKNKYVGLLTSTSHFRKERDSVKIRWKIDSLAIKEAPEKINGNWSFALSLDATERTTQVINQSVEHEGVVVNVGKIAVSPMSFIVYFDQIVSEKTRNKWHGVDVDIEIKDDLGNRYTGQGNGGSGDRDGYNMRWSKTFEKLDENATKLILTPRINFYEHTADNHGSIEMTKDGQKEIPVSLKTGKGREEYAADDIVIELKK